MFFRLIFMDIDNITSIKSTIIKEKSHMHPINPVYFIFIAEKSPEIIPKDKGYFFISKSFALN